MAEEINVKVGDKIRIISMTDEPHYNGRTGVVEHIDDICRVTALGAAVPSYRDSTPMKS